MLFISLETVMTLNNLVGISLESVVADAAMIQRLLHAAKSSLSDATVAGLSNETRFDVAYKAVMQLANAALQSNGFRTLTSRPGHHLTMIQSLVHSIGLDRKLMIELDALRKQRNVTDYSGDLVTDKACEACIKLANDLYNQVNQWIKENHPELLK